MEEWNSITSKSSKTNSPIVVDFTASWCKPCKKIAPFFEGLSKEYDGFFVKVDVDEMDEVRRGRGAKRRAKATRERSQGRKGG